jgi:hypothetical protein
MSAYTAPVYVILKNKQRRGNVKVLAPEAFSFVAWLILCGRKLLVHRLRPFTSVLTGDMCVFSIHAICVFSDSRPSADARQAIGRGKAC